MKSLLQRFEEKIMPEPNTGCWLWYANVNKKGYGKIGVYPLKYDLERESFPTAI